VSQGNLAGETGEEIEAMSANDIDANHVGHMLYAETKNSAQRRSNKRKPYKEKQQKSPHPALEPDGLEDILVVFVSAMK
jgi:hypothetical protein